MRLRIWRNLLRFICYLLLIFEAVVFLLIKDSKRSSFLEESEHCHDHDFLLNIIVDGCGIVYASGTAGLRSYQGTYMSTYLALSSICGIAGK